MQPTYIGRKQTGRVWGGGGYGGLAANDQWDRIPAVAHIEALRCDQQITESIFTILDA